MAGRPHRAELGMDEIRAATGMRNFADIDQGFQLAVLGIDDRDLIGLIGRDHEIALAGIPSAVVQVAGGIDFGDAEIVQIAVIHQQDLAGFLDVDHEFRLVVGGDDGGDARLRVVFLGIHRHAAGGDDFQRFERVAVHQHELRRPVRTGDGVFVLEPAMAYLSSKPLALEVSTERASRPTLISATLSGFSIHRSIRLILASRPITNR